MLRRILGGLSCPVYLPLLEGFDGFVVVVLFALLTFFEVVNHEAVVALLKTLTLVRGACGFVAHTPCISSE